MKIKIPCKPGEHVWCVDKRWIGKPGKKHFKYDVVRGRIVYWSASGCCDWVITHDIKYTVHLFYCHDLETLDGDMVFPDSQKSAALQRAKELNND